MAEVTLENLEHWITPFGEGGEVLVLNTGAVITPEMQAMLCALHSRSVGGIRHHLREVAKRGAEKFMNTTYVGYGHKSIGDCGNTAVFIDGLSMLAAKAFQDFPLYNGQECSTRYIDFSEQPFIDPVGTSASHEILERWRSFYLHGISVLIPVLMERHPMDSDESPSVYEKAIKARAFDIMRAFLPAGASTGEGWVGELRQFSDRLPTLRHHPLEEVRNAAHALEQSLTRAFPSTFLRRTKECPEGELVRYAATEEYLATIGSAFAYTDFNAPGFRLSEEMIDMGLWKHYRPLFEHRPPKTELPYNVRELGTMQFEFLLDFGSWRDLQRQRAVIMPMPLLTRYHGFEPWYLEQMPQTLREEAETLILEQSEAIGALGLKPELEQYLLPMGYRVATRVTGDLRGLVYLVELRATRFVHPTLRHRAIQMAESMNGILGRHGLVLHLDAEPDRFDAARGKHDIIIGKE